MRTQKNPSAALRFARKYGVAGSVSSIWGEAEGGHVTLMFVPKPLESEAAKRAMVSEMKKLPFFSHSDGAAPWRVRGAGNTPTASRGS